MALFSALRQRAATAFIAWLTAEPGLPGAPPGDAPGVLTLQPGDVVLVEGHSRVSKIIKSLAQSSWSHVALYVGRPGPLAALSDRPEIGLAPDEPLLLEGVLGQGVVLTPLASYRAYRIRICRARGLTAQDRERVLRYTLARLGCGYDLRQLLDLARFLLPWTLLPRRLGSSLFQQQAGLSTRTVCSALIAEAFQSVDFPVQPVVFRDVQGQEHWHKRNTRLYTPKDFDLSPHFDVVKPAASELPYRDIPWEARSCNDVADCETALPVRPRP